jgi:hypothetical protein
VGGFVTKTWVAIHFSSERRKRPPIGRLRGKDYLGLTGR